MFVTRTLSVSHACSGVLEWFQTNDNLRDGLMVLGRHNIKAETPGRAEISACYGKVSQMFILSLKYIHGYEICQLGITVLNRYSTYVGPVPSNLPSFGRAESR